MTKTKNRFSPFWKQCFVTGAVCCDVVGQGSIIGYPAVLLPQLAKPGSTIPLTENDASWIASVLGISMMMGVFVTPPLMGRLGRKTAHFVVLLTMISGWITVAVSSSVMELIIGRILKGFAYGIFTPLRSILIGEYTCPKNRGAFLMTISLSQGFGILLAHLVGSLMSWQRTALFCTIFPFISLIMTMFSPESPSWLAGRGRYDECRKVFHWLRGHEEEDELERMIEARIIAKKPENIQKVNRYRMVTNVMVKKEFYKPIIVMLHAYCMLCFSGGITLPNYTTQIISLIAGPEANASFWMVTFDIQRIIVNVMAIYVISKVKRRTMLFTTLGMCITMNLVIASYVYAKDCSLIHYDAQWLPIFLIHLHYFTIAVGTIPMPVVISGEIFPLAYRSLGGSIGATSYALFMFLAIKTFLALVDNLGLHGTYAVYTGILIYCFTVIWICLPETKGKTLQQIEDEFKGIYLKREEIEVRESLQCPQQIAPLIIK